MSRKVVRVIHPRHRVVRIPVAEIAIGDPVEREVEPVADPGRVVGHGGVDRIVSVDDPGLLTREDLAPLEHALVPFRRVFRLEIILGHDPMLLDDDWPSLIGESHAMSTGPGRASPRSGTALARLAGDGATHLAPIHAGRTARPRPESSPVPLLGFPPWGRPAGARSGVPR